MNPVALPMMPKVSNNQIQPLNPSVPNSTEKFGAVLEKTISNEEVATKSDSSQTDLTTEQKEVLVDLLAFLGMDSVKELDDGNEAAVAQFLASIVNLDSL